MGICHRDIRVNRKSSQRPKNNKIVLEHNPKYKINIDASKVIEIND